MDPNEHEKYAKQLLSSLADEHPDTEHLKFELAPGQSRNAARAMTEILLHRLAKKSRDTPTLKFNTTYEWNEGIFNCRNISDRPNFFTNIRPTVAQGMREFGVEKPTAFLFAVSDPARTQLSVWALPEPLVNDWVSSVQSVDVGPQYPLQIFPKEQRIYKWAESPDLVQYFGDFPLSQYELQVLREAREADFLEKAKSKTERLEDSSDSNEGDEANEAGLGRESRARSLLDHIARQLNELGEFDPSRIADSRERVLRSIVRRRGQPAFRESLLAAYDGRCAITDCDLDVVLDAAHIIPYRGEETNHAGNGLLLRTDIHTLFDLKLIAIDATSMCVLISASLDGTCYEELRGRAIKVPEATRDRPSRHALEEHRESSRL